MTPRTPLRARSRIGSFARFPGILLALLAAPAFAGCRVTDGTVERGANVRLIRDNVVIHEGKLSQLKRFKDDVKEVNAGMECGMAFENYQDMRQGDVIECYRVETIQRSL